MNLHPLNERAQVSLHERVMRFGGEKTLRIAARRQRALLDVRPMHMSSTASMDLRDMAAALVDLGYMTRHRDEASGYEHSRLTSKGWRFATGTVPIEMMEAA